MDNKENKEFGPVRNTCSTCRFWEKFEGKTDGECTALPPVPILEGENRVGMYRPDTHQTMLACIYHMPAQGCEKETIMDRCMDVYLDAIEKHPDFPNVPREAAPIITEEYLELIRAINDREPSHRIIAEAYDVIVTCMRLIREITRAEEEHHDAI